MNKVVYINNLRGSKGEDSINIQFVHIYLDEPKKHSSFVNHIAMTWNMYQGKWDFDILDYWGHASLNIWRISS